MTDMFTIDTCDHAKVNIVLSYSWHFNVNKVLIIIVGFYSRRKGQTFFS